MKHCIGCDLLLNNLNPYSSYSFLFSFLNSIECLVEFLVFFPVSYDYDWKSNRWASGTVTHVVDIIALSDDSLGNTKSGPHTITVLSCASSAPFVVASTKKSTATAGPKTTGEKRKQPSAGINVGPSPPRQKHKDIKNPFHFPMTMGGGGGLGWCTCDCLD